MMRRPFDPNELDQPSGGADPSVKELESYLADTATGAPRGLEQRVMAAVEQEPAPRRGFLAWLLTPSTAGTGVRGFARAGLLGATLVLAVTGALFAGQLADLVRNVGSGSPTPTVSPSPSSSESVAPSPSLSPLPSASGSPEASGQSPQASPQGTAHETPEATDQETPCACTPGPSASPTAQETPEQSN